MIERRKLNEIAHGKKIAPIAEDVWGRSSVAGRMRIERRINLMVRHGAIGVGSTVLELGCGTGEFTANLARTGARIVALDISPDLVEIAKEKLKNFKNVECSVGDAERLEQFSDGFFSNIVGISILHHLDYIKTLKACYEKLRGGGTIFFSEPNMANPQIMLQKNIPWLKRMMGDSPDETAFFRLPLQRNLLSIGYRDVRVVNFDFLHPVIPDGMARFVDVPLQVLENVPLVKEISGSLLITANK